MKYLNRRQFVSRSSSLAATVAVPTLAGIGCTEAKMDEADLSAKESIHAQAKKGGLQFGAAILASQLKNDRAFREAVIRECGVLTHENELKWATLQNRENQEYNFSKADYIVDFAEEHNMAVRGHTLVWHLGYPKYLDQTVNPKSGRDIMVAHIEELSKHYAGRMHSWDVVNEAIDIKYEREDGLAETLWFKAMGEEYLDIAFETAHKADPKALMVYNENGLVYGRERHDKKRKAVLDLLKRRLSNNIPLDALGIQSHLSIGQHPFERDKFVGFLNDVADLGLRIYITELDVRDTHGPADIATRDQLVADEYKRFMEIIVDHPAVDMIVTWGLSDKYTWINEWAPRLDGLPARPLPLDHKMRRKKGWDVIVESLEARQKNDL